MSVLDFFTTYYILEENISTESNPLMLAILTHLGIWALLYTKLLVLLILLWVIIRLGRVSKLLNICMTIALSAQTLVVCISLFLLWSFHGIQS
jgi:hypothetical protein